MQVRLVVLRPGEHDVGGCPLDIEAEPAAAAGPETEAGVEAEAEAQQAPAAAYRVFFPERQPAELLRWFAATFPDGAGRLDFPASLSKQERARWHAEANRHRLHKQSLGVGDARHLRVGTAPLDAEAGGLPTQGGKLLLTAEQARRADEIYTACQMEGGKHWERSRGEVEALVASGQPLPADLQELAERRLRGQEVLRMLKAGQPSEALSLLSEDPKLAWIKDPESGGYAIHIAAWKGYESVVLFLASLPGALEQRDGRRETALAVARRRRHAAIEELLLEAGAKSEHASFHEGPAPSSSGGDGAAEEGGEYCSWSREERLRYRHGGVGPPPGLGARGRGRGRMAGGRMGGAGSGGRGGARQPPPSQGPEQQERPKCPW